MHRPRAFLAQPTRASAPFASTVAASAIGRQSTEFAFAVHSIRGNEELGSFRGDRREP